MTCCRLPNTLQRLECIRKLDFSKVLLPWHNMNYLIQRGKVRQQAINVPDGLPELLSDITREVLRCQPTKECMCQFIIDYLHSVIVTREKAMVAKSILDRSLREVDHIISDLCVCDLAKDKSDMMAQVIEDCFRNFLERRRCEMRRGKEMIKFRDIDMLQELIEKCNFTDAELERSRPTIESAYKRFVDAYMAAAEGSRGTEILYQYFRDRELKRIDDNIRDKAATMIQATWRGYFIRRELHRYVCSCQCMMDNEVDEKAERENKAAGIIQRFLKNYVRPKIFMKKLDPCEEPPSLPTTIDVDRSDQKKEIKTEPETEATPTEVEEPTEPVDEPPPPEAVPSPPPEVMEVKAEPEAAPEPVEAEEPAEPLEEPPAEVPPEAPEVPAPAEEEPAAEEPPTEEAPAEEAPAEEPPAEEAPAEEAPAEE